MGVGDLHSKLFSAPHPAGGLILFSARGKLTIDARERKFSIGDVEFSRMKEEFCKKLEDCRSSAEAEWRIDPCWINE